MFPLLLKLLNCIDNAAENLTMTFCMGLSPSQVLVIIDVKPKDLGLPTEAYFSVEEIHDVSGA